MLTDDTTRLCPPGSAAAWDAYVQDCDLAHCPPSRRGRGVAMPLGKSPVNPPAQNRRGIWRVSIAAPIIMMPAVANTDGRANNVSSTALTIGGPSWATSR